MIRVIWYWWSSPAFSATTTTSTAPMPSRIRIRVGRPATASMTSSTMVMMMAVPRSGCISTSTMGMPAMTSSRTTSAQDKPLGAARAVGGDGHDEGQDGELRGLQLEGPEAEPTLRPCGARPDVRDQHGQQRDHGHRVDEHPHRLEAAVVDEGHHHHAHQAQDHPQHLALEVGRRALPGRGQDAAGGRVHHDHPDGRHGQRGADQHHVDAEHAPVGGRNSGARDHRARTGRQNIGREPPRRPARCCRPAGVGRPGGGRRLGVRLAVLPVHQGRGLPLHRPHAGRLRDPAAGGGPGGGGRRPGRPLRLAGAPAGPGPGGREGRPRSGAPMVGPRPA